MVALTVKQKKFKLQYFPFTTIIKETHLIRIGFLSKPITEEHERFVKVLNEHEVYVFKNPEHDCHICAQYYGHIKRENINQDPFVGKVLTWYP